MANNTENTSIDTNGIIWRKSYTCPYCDTPIIYASDLEAAQARGEETSVFVCDGCGSMGDFGSLGATWDEYGLVSDYPQFDTDEAADDDDYEGYAEHSQLPESYGEKLYRLESDHLAETEDEDDHLDEDYTNRYDETGRAIPGQW